MNTTGQHYARDLRRYYHMPVTQISLTVVLSLFIMAVFIVLALRPTIIAIVKLQKTIGEARITGQQLESKISDLEKVAIEGIKNFEGFLKEIGLPTRLEQAGIHDDRIEEMASKCTESGPIGEFMKLEYQDVLNIYKLAL